MHVYPNNFEHMYTEKINAVKSETMRSNFPTIVNKIK